jgi:transposase
VFADESGFLLIPNLAKTWAPVGETPIHRHTCRRDRISVISGVTVSPKRRQLGLYYLLYYDNIGHDEVCLFLRHLLRHLRGAVVVLLDNAKIHNGGPLDELVGRHSRLHIEHFPAYAPELNPDEGVWCQAKQDLANSCPKDVDELMEDIIRSMNKIGKSHSKLLGCIEGTELPSFLR